MGVNYYTDSFNTTTIIVITTTTLSFYNSLELLLIFITFNVYRGLYFWSLLISTSGLIPYCIDLVLLYFQLSSNLPALIANKYGWCAFVTGQRVVLCSCRGLIIGKGNTRLLKFVKWMIIVDPILFHPHHHNRCVWGRISRRVSPTTVSAGYTSIEKIQMTGFCIQAFFISGLYVLKTLDILKTQDAIPQTSSSSDQFPKKHVYRVLIQFFLINFLIITLDIALLVRQAQLEFAVLSKLVETSSAPANQVKSRNLSIIADRIDFRGTPYNGSPPMPAMNSHGATSTGLDFAVDLTRKSVNAHLRTTPTTSTISGPSRPQWMDDLEKSGIATMDKVDSRDAEFAQQEQIQEDSTSTIQFESTNYRKARKGSDLLYADAIHSLSKREV